MHDDEVSELYVGHRKLVELINREMCRIDVGVRSLDVVENRDGSQLEFRHDGLDKPMSLLQESHGTVQFLKIFPLIADVLATGSIAIIDDLDSALHPTLLAEIFGWFYDPERNPFNAQLWMSCRNVSLLEELTKEEVVFCEKDWQGSTTVYSLRDIKHVRRDDNYSKKYLGGVYGAVPRIG